jgi:hypothetical protein
LITVTVFSIAALVVASRNFDKSSGCEQLLAHKLSVFSSEWHASSSASPSVPCAAIWSDECAQSVCAWTAPAHVNYTVDTHCNEAGEVTNISFHHVLSGMFPQAAADALFAASEALQSVDLSENDLSGTLPKLSHPDTTTLVQLQLGGNLRLTGG